MERTVKYRLSRGRGGSARPTVASLGTRAALGKAWANRYLYLMIVPGIAFYLLFAYAPMYGIVLAFKHYMYNKGITRSPWIGLANFMLLFENTDFWNTAKNTIVISFGKIVFGFPIPIAISLMLNALSSQRYKGFVQSVLYLPHFISWIIMGGLIYNLLSVTNGVYGKLMVEVFSVQPELILGNPRLFRPLVYLSSIWKETGWGTIIYLAVIAGIDPMLYESARMDGAGRFRQAIHITVPSLSFAVVVTLVLSLGNVMNAGFDQVINLYGPGVYKVGDIIDTYIYRMGVQGARYEFSTAVGLFKSVINCTLLLAANGLTRSIGQRAIY